MSRASKVKIGSHWKKPPSKVYDYNYNFQEGYYKPMLDHLDKKDRGIHEEAPGAQTFAERCARHCPGCLASREPSKVSFGPGHNHGPDHGHHHHGPSGPNRSLSIPEDDSLLGPRRKPRGLSPSPLGDYDGLGMDPADSAGSPGGRLGRHPRLRLPNLDNLGEDPDWGNDDFGSGFGPSRRAGRRTPDSHLDSSDNDGYGSGRRGRGMRSPDIDGMMRDLGLDSPLSKRGIKGNTSPDVLLGRDNALMLRSGASGSSMLSSDMSNSMESSMRMKRRSYNLTAVTEKTTVASG